MKRMIKALVKKGWTKNEVIYEIKRIYGNDVLILKSRVEDDRSFVAKYGLGIFAFSIFSGVMFLRK
jgi:hypothetical protein